MKQNNKVEVKLSGKELEYLKELIKSQIFNLQGVVKVSKNKELKGELNLLESLGGKIITPNL